MHIDQLLNSLTPEIYQRFKTAIELRKWPTGERLTQQQLETCMEAVIAYEARHVAEEDRIGYIPPKKDTCGDDSHIHTVEKPLSWK